MRQSALAITLLATGASALAAQQPALAAQPSTRATAVVTLTGPRGSGLSPASISIDYGQPHLRGRTLHTAELVPLDKVWRFGANTSTTLETGVDLTIGGHAVPAGKYSLYALPSASGWKLIVNKNTGQWGTDYAAEHDLVRIDLTRRVLHEPVESFTVWLSPTFPQSGAASGELRFAWGTEQHATTWTVR